MKKYDYSFVIDRSKWRTGQYGDHKTGKGYTQLYNSKGYMCCLGMILEQCGMHKNELLGFGEPAVMTSSSPQIHLLASFLIDKDCSYLNSRLANEAININDCDDTTPEHKEKELTALFDKHGIHLEFKGKYAKH